MDIIGALLSPLAALLGRGGQGTAPSSDNQALSRKEPVLLPPLSVDQTILGSDIQEKTARQRLEVALGRLVPALNGWAALLAGGSREDGKRRIASYARALEERLGAPAAARCQESYERVYDLPPSLRERIPALLGGRLAAFQDEEALRALALQACLSNATEREAAFLKEAFLALGVSPRQARRAARRARRLRKPGSRPAS